MDDTPGNPLSSALRSQEQIPILSLTSSVLPISAHRRNFRPWQPAEGLSHVQGSPSAKTPARNGEGVGISTLPIPCPQMSVRILGNVGVDNVFKSLELLRSISNEELGALLTFRDWSDDSIRDCLQSGRDSATASVLHTRQAGHLTVPQPLSLYGSTPYTSTQQGSPHTNTTNLSGLQSPFSDTITPDTGRSLRSRNRHAQSFRQEDLPSGTTSASLIIGDHVHWCTVCKPPRKIDKCDGYKRHEKEHETRFYCMPFGAVGDQDGSSYCTLCGISNPTESHFEGHQLGNCIQRRRSFARKSSLVTHLNTHGAKHCEALAEGWCLSSEKKAYACGFCGQYLPNMIDRLNHIDAHYKKHQDIHEWDTNKVIEGLLRQPRLSELWRHIVWSNATIVSCYKWDQSVVENLRLRLEMGVEDPHDLAMAALKLSTPYRAFLDRLTLGTSHLAQGMDSGQTLIHCAHHDTVMTSHDPASMNESIQQGQPFSAVQASSHDFDDSTNTQFGNVRHQDLSYIVPLADPDVEMDKYLWDNNRPSPSLEASICRTFPQPAEAHHILDSTQGRLHTSTDGPPGSSYGIMNERSLMTCSGIPNHPFIPRSDNYEPPNKEVRGVGY